MLAVFKKELQAYFSSLTGYMFMGFFLFLAGLFFTLTNLINMSPDYNSVLGSITFIFLLVVPILTMRLMAEEARQKTDQLLLTTPLSLSGIVLGKYFAAVAVFFLTLVVTFIFPIILSTLGTIAVAEIVGGYIGFFLLGSALIAVGLFISSLTENQVIAAVVTFSALLLLWILDWIVQGLPMDRTSGIVFAGILTVVIALVIYLTMRNYYVGIGVLGLGAIIIGAVYFVRPALYDGFIIRFFQWFSLLNRYQDFSLGVLSLSPIVYYITFSSAFVFLTVRMLEKKRWS